MNNATFTPGQSYSVDHHTVTVTRRTAKTVWFTWGNSTKEERCKVCNSLGHEGLFYKAWIIDANQPENRTEAEKTEAVLSNAYYN